MNFDLCLFPPIMQIRKKGGGDEIKKNSSPLKLLNQFQPNFAEMILRWSPFKIVSDSRALPPRWPPQCSCVVIESSFDPGERLQAPGSLWLNQIFKILILFILYFKNYKR